MARDFEAKKARRAFSESQDSFQDTVRSPLLLQGDWRGSMADVALEAFESCMVWPEERVVVSRILTTRSTKDQGPRDGELARPFSGRRRGALN
jgi:hypothetical protein